LRPDLIDSPVEVVPFLYSGSLMSGDGFSGGGTSGPPVCEDPSFILLCCTVRWRLFNVSFITVRDALQVLEGEALVVSSSGRGAWVTPIYLDGLDTIYRLRKLLEPDLARRACILHTDEQLDHLP